MAEYTRVEDMPGYLQAFTDHQIALREAGGDEAAELRAKLAWSEKSRALENERLAFNSTQQSFDQARNRMKEQFPDVPESVYATASTPEAMEEAAKAFDEALKAKVSEVAPAPGTGGSGGQPPSSLGAGNQSGEADWTDRRRELREKLDSSSATRAEKLELANIRASGQMVPAAMKAVREAENRS